ncbi:uroporphyrinogen-III synthase [Gulosibacter molinativorax]|uniref:Uroporphyrinogen-III synthase n=1 Tax=Gulosibacter molinativorax TaxID=256821 RepID=A0ABT7CA28_9MICO|nr:uroporphyrinogen-III synthase [Gulosibacter molinativorax]MDJ1371955.1 uroporphyrinogen-III synthase [Gulosibacter molinativorax]QUY62681.1 Uroporphyrinogen III synthase [Gulosibacter molinativorax]
MVTASLAGTTVLVPRGGDWGTQASLEIAERGGEPVIAELIGFAPPEDPAPLEAAQARLANGDYDWLVLTSPRAVTAIAIPERNSNAIAKTELRIHRNTRIAVVGDSTAAGLESFGRSPHFVPVNEHSARGLVSEWPHVTAPQRILWPRSSEAAPTIATGLTALGHRVDATIAYRTVGVPLTAEARARILTGELRFALVTSGSIARQLVDQIGADAPLRIVTIGPNTTRSAREAGLRVDFEAAQRTVSSMLDAIEQGREPEGE